MRIKLFIILSFFLINCNNFTNQPKFSDKLINFFANCNNLNARDSKLSQPFESCNYAIIIFQKGNYYLCSLNDIEIQYLKTNRDIDYINYLKKITKGDIKLENSNLKPIKLDFSLINGFRKTRFNDFLQENKYGKNTGVIQNNSEVNSILYLFMLNNYLIEFDDVSGYYTYEIIK